MIPSAGRKWERNNEYNNRYDICTRVPEGVSGRLHVCCRVWVSVYIYFSYYTPTWTTCAVYDPGKIFVSFINTLKSDYLAHRHNIRTSQYESGPSAEWMNEWMRRNWNQNKKNIICASEFNKIRNTAVWRFHTKYLTKAK